MPGETAVLVEIHPTPEVLAAFGRGGLTPTELAAVAEHVERCDSCCALLMRVPDDTLIGLAKQAGHAPTHPTHVKGAPRCGDPTAIPAALAEHPRYRILDQLGAGGMGVVYKAEHRMMGRTVALKVMAPHLTAKPDAVERFRREVKAAAQLSHANIVTAHDADEADGLHFLVMEFVDGISLDRLVARKGPQPVAMACHFARQAALGLQHAFEKGMIHRDIKPQNLVVTRKGQVKILDFGLARFARGTEPEVEAGAKPPLAPLTAASLLMGTPEYLSPEQARSSRGLDIRSDLYSLGGTLYFLLTGSVPFPHATTLIDKLLAHTGEDPKPLLSLRPDVPEALAAVVAKLMAKDPAARFATPAEAAAALAPFTRGPATVAPTPVPGSLPALAPLPAATTIPNGDAVFAFDTENDVVRPAIPARAHGDSTVRRTPQRRAPLGKWTALAGVVVLGLLVGVLARQARKSPAAERAGTAPPPAKAEPKSNASGVVPATVPAMPASPRTVLVVVPQQGVWMPDYTPMRERLEANGVKVTVASNAPGRALAAFDHLPTRGQSIPIDAVLSEDLDVSELAAVAFCGKNCFPFINGQSAAATRSLIDKLLAANKPVGAICVAQSVLASHGYLRGQPAAWSPFVSDKFPDRADWRRDRVVTAGKIVTASTADDAVEFADALLALLNAG